MAPSTQQQQANTFDAPPYEADWIVDEAHKPESLIDRHGRNAQSPAAHDVYKRAVTEKAQKFGLIHIDPATGYRARFQPQRDADARDEARAGETGDRRADTTGRGDQGGGQAAGSRQQDTRGLGTRFVDAVIEDRTGQTSGASARDERDARIADLERQLADARATGGGQA